MMGRIQSRSQSPRYPCPAERLTGNEIEDASSHPSVGIVTARAWRAQDSGGI